MPQSVLKMVQEKKITAGHAKILVGLDNADFVALKIVEKKLSVRQTENFVKLFKKNKKITIRKQDSNLKELERSIETKIGLSVKIKNSKRNKGSITFSYHDLNQLNKIIDIIKSNY